MIPTDQKAWVRGLRPSELQDDKLGGETTHLFRAQQGSLNLTLKVIGAH